MITKEKNRNKRILQQIGDKLAMGLTDNQIAEQISKENNVEMSGSIVKSIIKKQSIRKKEFIESDNDFGAIYKENIIKLIEKANANIDILDKTRQFILDKFEEIKNSAEDLKINNYYNQITSAIRTQNDSIRTLNELLKRLEIDTKEIEISTVEAVSQTLEILKQLEGDGLITINPSYYNSNIYKINSKKKED